MGRPGIPDEERQRIIAAMREGKTRNEIAKEFGRAPQTIGNIAKEISHVFGQLNNLRAQQATRAYNAEWRARAMNRWAQVHDELLDDLNKPTVVYNFGGKDNTYNEHTLDKPDAKTKRDIVNAAAVAWRTADAIHKSDQERATGKPEALLAFFGQLQEELGTAPPDDQRKSETEAIDSLEQPKN